MRRRGPRVTLAAVAVALAGCLGATTDSPAPVDILSPGKWTPLAPMPTARQEVAVAELNGRVFVVGGFGSGSEAVATVEVYDPATNGWSTGTPLPVGRGGLAAAVLGDRVYVFGGEAPLRIFSANEMYEVAGNRWIAKDPMRTPRHGIGAAVVGNRIYVPGGGTQPGYAATNVNEAYAP